MILTLSFLLNVVWAQSDALIAHLESKSYLLNGKLVVSSQEPQLLNGLKEQGLIVERLPTIGNTDAEVERLHQKFSNHCLVVIGSDETVTDSPINGIKFTEVGNCSIDPNLRFVIESNGSQWSVETNRGDSVSVHTFATVCEDLPLKARLDYEDTVANRNARILYVGSIGLATSVIFTTGNPDPGFSSREENRFWTSVFLLGSAAILHTQRDTPHVYRIDRQEDLQNYYSRKQAQRIIDRTFPALEEEKIEPTTEVQETSEPIESNEENEEISNPEKEITPEVEMPKTSTTPKDEANQ